MCELITWYSMDKIGQDSTLLLMNVTKSYRSYTCSTKIWIANVSSSQRGHVCMLVVMVIMIVHTHAHTHTHTHSIWNKMREEGVCRYMVFHL